MKTAITLIAMFAIAILVILLMPPCKRYATVTSAPGVPQMCVER